MLGCCAAVSQCLTGSFVLSLFAYLHWKEERMGGVQWGAKSELNEPPRGLGRVRHPNTFSLTSSLFFFVVFLCSDLFNLLLFGPVTYKLGPHLPHWAGFLLKVHMRAKAENGVQQKMERKNGRKSYLHKSLDWTSCPIKCGHGWFLYIALANLQWSMQSSTQM